MDKLMDNENLWHLRNQIFKDLSHEDVLNCRRVCKYWNESLRRISDVKFIEEFGDRDLEYTNEKVSTVIPGWKNTAQKYGVQATFEDLEKVKESLKNLARGKGKCCSVPVHVAAFNGDNKLVEFIIRTSYDMNTKDGSGRTAWHLACEYGRTETAQLIIQNSKDFGIDLNAKDESGYTAWHLACEFGQIETAQLIIQNSKEFAIDLNATDDWERTAWYLACINGQTETAQLIIQSPNNFGIDLNAKDYDGVTPFHDACKNGKTETAQLIIQISKDFGIDLNAEDNGGRTAWHWACYYGQTETAQLIIQSSKEFGIDLNAKDNDGKTALHWACSKGAIVTALRDSGKTETVQMILKNWKEFSIDIKAQDNDVKTVLDLINEESDEDYYEYLYDEIKKMLEKEYSQIDVTESVQSLNLD